jgi:hypothetical protein
MLARKWDQKTRYLSTSVATQTFATTHWCLPCVQLRGLRINNRHHCQCAFDLTVVAGHAIMQQSSTLKPVLGTWGTWVRHERRRVRNARRRVLVA